MANKKIRIKVSRVVYYIVETDKLPENWNNDTLSEMEKSGQLDDICIYSDYEEFDEPEIEVEEV